MKYFFLLAVVLFCHNTKAQQGKTQWIEGLFYYDQQPVRIEIKDGRVASITRIKNVSAENKDVYIGPGLIDNQVNGYNGVSFSLGDMRFEEADVRKVTEGLWKAGVTSYVPTLRPNSQQNLLRNLAILAKAKRDPAIRGAIPGFQLEGPYESPVDGFRGAHALEYIRKPDWNEFMQLYEASGKNILMVSLAPEVDGAMSFIKQCREKNIVVSLGHHNGSASQVKEAADLGAQNCTHLGNGLPNNINRHDNPIWPQLSDDRLMISIIGDGFHLLPDEIRVFYKVKGPQRTIITSDVTRYAGMKPGKYLNSEGDTIELTKEGAVMYVARQALSGSASPITKGVGNVMKVTGCTMAEAFQMGSSNAARLLGLKDRGELKPGMRADIILFTLKDNTLHIKKTIVAGDIVYDSGK